MRRFNSRERNEQHGSDAKTVEAAAVRLLARREHSTEELRRKLVGKGHDATLVAAVVEKLTAKRLVSDDRFAASFVHHHARRGQGPVRIRANLRQQGIADSMIEQEVGNPEVDWSRVAAQVRQRKFGAAQPQSLSERAKQARFLQYRGFSADQIRAALSFDPDIVNPELADGDLDVSDPDARR
ncbi:MAG: regulatory protein RecX [Steroidobacter sp.]